MTDLQHPGVPAGASPPSPSDPKQAVKQEAGEVASTAVDSTKQTAAAAAEATSQVAGTAVESAREVAGTAAEQAAQVTQQASEQARQLVEKAQTDLRQQASSQTERAAGSLKDVSQQIRALADGKTDEAGPVLDITRQIADKIGDAASWVDRRGFDGVVEDVQDLARRRPGLFLLGAATAGVVVGRLGRGMQAVSQQSSPDSPSGAAAAPATSGPLPPALPPTLPPATAGRPGAGMPPPPAFAPPAPPAAPPLPPAAPSGLGMPASPAAWDA